MIKALRGASLLAMILPLAMGTARAGETITYTYDALGRLVATSSSGTVNNGQVVSVTYDPAGNRTNYTLTGASGGGGSAPVISVGAASANEGTSLSFPVTLSAPAPSALTVNYQASNGTAVAPTNYTATSGTLSIPAGASSGTVVVPTVRDNVVTANLSMNLGLSSPSSGATLGTASATGTVVNIDVASWNSSLTSGTSQFCYSTCSATTGFLSGVLGSMSNTAYSGYTVTAVYNSGGSVILVLTDPNGVVSPPNSGWTSITIPGVGTLYRAAASYSTGTGYAGWSWTNSGVVASGTVTIQ